MAWKKRYPSISIDVDLDEFEVPDLLQGLIDNRVLSEAEAERIFIRHNRREKAEALKLDVGVVSPDLEDATHDMRCGRLIDAKLKLERALGWEWSGKLR